MPSKGRTNKFLEDAMIPRNVEEFLAENGGIVVRLLLNYIEELEKLNQTLNADSAALAAAVRSLQKEVEALKTEVQRLKDERIMKPFTPEEIERRNAEKAEKEKAQPWKNPRAAGAKRGTGKNKGWVTENRKKR